MTALSFLQTHALTLLLIVAFLMFYVFDKENTKLALKWLAGVLTEPDNNGGKASISRVVGVYSTWNVVQQSWMGIKDSLTWDVFMVSIGYMMASKALNNVTPAILDFAKGYMNKHLKVAP